MRVIVANIQIVSHSIDFLSLYASSRLFLEEIAACGCLVSRGGRNPVERGGQNGPASHESISAARVIGDGGIHFVNQLELFGGWVLLVDLVACELSFGFLLDVGSIP